jgi:hypothetical protein
MALLLPSLRKALKLGAGITDAVTRRAVQALETWADEMTRRLAELEDTGPLTGSGSPSGNVTAPIGTLYINTDGGAGTTLYVKESGSGSTGWAAK